MSPLGPVAPIDPCSPWSPLGPWVPCGSAGPFWFQLIAVSKLRQVLPASVAAVDDAVGAGDGRIGDPGDGEDQGGGARATRHAWLPSSYLMIDLLCWLC